MNKPPTIKQIAERLGVSVRRVNQLKAVGLPVHDLDLAADWKREHIANATDSAELLRQARIKLLFQQERRARLDADSTAGLLVLRSEVDADSLQTAFMLKRGMLDLQNALPGELVGLTEVEMSKRIRHHVYRILEGLYRGKYSAPPEVREVVESMNPNKKNK